CDYIVGTRIVPHHSLRLFAVQAVGLSPGGSRKSFLHFVIEFTPEDILEGISDTIPDCIPDGI
ncbi:MAG: hypothetical protein K2I91_01820, partial [Muribaculaceae bacterium]|nr:hypothetical protein [Muribaculaceae bacterium]